MNDKYIQNEEIAWQVYDGEAVLVDPAGAVCRILNETATTIWEACAQPCDADGIVAAVCAEYDVSAEQARADIDEIIADLTERGLLKKAE